MATPNRKIFVKFPHGISYNITESVFKGHTPKLIQTTIENIDGDSSEIKTDFNLLNEIDQHTYVGIVQDTYHMYFEHYGNIFKYIILRYSPSLTNSHIPKEFVLGFQYDEDKVSEEEKDPEIQPILVYALNLYMTAIAYFGDLELESLIMKRINNEVLNIWIGHSNKNGKLYNKAAECMDKIGIKYQEVFPFSGYTIYPYSDSYIKRHNRKFGVYDELNGSFESKHILSAYMDINQIRDILNRCDRRDIVVWQNINYIKIIESVGAYHNYISNECIWNTSLEYAQKYFQLIDKEKITRNLRISEEFIINCYRNEIYLNIYPFREYSDEFIQAIHRTLVWSADYKNNDSCKRTKLSEKSIRFILQSDHKVSSETIDVISRSAFLTEEIISEYRTSLNWKIISKYFNITSSFYMRFANMLDVSEPWLYSDLPPEFIIREKNIPEGFICMNLNYRIMNVEQYENYAENASLILFLKYAENIGYGFFKKIADKMINRLNGYFRRQYDCDNIMGNQELSYEEQDQKIRDTRKRYRDNDDEKISSIRHYNFEKIYNVLHMIIKHRKMRYIDISANIFDTILTYRLSRDEIGEYSDDLISEEGEERHFFHYEESVKWIQNIYKKFNKRGDLIRKFIETITK